MSAVHSTAGVMVLTSASSGAGERTKVQRGFNAEVTELLISGMGIVKKSRVIMQHLTQAARSC